MADPERSAAVAAVADALEGCFAGDPRGQGVSADVAVTSDGRWVSACYTGLTDDNRAVQARCEEAVRDEFGLH